MKIIYLAAALGILLTGCNNGSEKITSTETSTSTPAPATGTETAPLPAPATSGSANSQLPSFNMKNSMNQLVDLAGFKGKKVFVNLWATWCPPCRAEIPSIEKLAAKTDKNKTAFVMLSLDDNFEKAKTYATNNNMKLPVYYPAANLPQLFVTDGIPMTVIFNEKGEIVFNQVGSADYDTKVFLDMLK
jgi:thiol-disulfide isomerase/thioredoxin